MNKKTIPIDSVVTFRNEESVEGGRRHVAIARIRAVVNVPESVDEAAIRKDLLDAIEQRIFGKAIVSFREMYRLAGAECRNEAMVAEFDDIAREFKDVARIHFHEE